MIDYLYVYAFVYLKQNSNTSILFNVYNKKRIVSSNPNVYKIVSRIFRSQLTYKGCVIFKKEFLDPIVRDFINKVLEFSMGGYMKVKKGEMPIQFPSEIFVSDYTDIENKILSYDFTSKRYKNEYDSLFSKISKEMMQNFIGLTIYIGGVKDTKYKFVSNQYKYPFYSEDNTIIDLDIILNWISPHKPDVLNLVVGDIGERELIKIKNDISLETLSVNWFILSDYLSFFEIDYLKRNNNSFYVWTPVSIKNEELHLINVYFYYLCENEDDMKCANNNSAGDNTYILPFYNGRNYSFCKKHLSYSFEELKNSIDEEYQFRINHIINSNIFGEIRIDTWGNVFSDINKNKLGTIFETSLDDIIYFELFKYRNWFFSRNLLPICSECLYSDLCPPISDFENYCNKYKLCKEKKRQF